MLNLILLCLRIGFTGVATNLKLTNGTYKVQLWGASGAKSSKGATGGRGAYIETIMKLKKDIEFFAVVGGAAKETAGGYNGGGNGVKCGNYYSGGGGGATDLRTSNEYKGRILVAAGGSGASGNTKGKPGGDLTGRYDSDTTNKVDQTNGNENGIGDSPSSGVCNDGCEHPYSGGGGGYRGGRVGNTMENVCPVTENKVTSSSGSSFIYKYPNANNEEPKGWSNDIQFYFPATKLQSGDNPEPLPEGGEAENGLLIITPLNYFQKEFDCRSEDTPFRTVDNSFIEKVKNIFFGK